MSAHSSGGHTREWVHCSPGLLAIGIDCAEQPRRACICGVPGGSHDHLVTAEQAEQAAAEQVRRRREMFTGLAEAAELARQRRGGYSGEHEPAAPEPEARLAPVPEGRVDRVQNWVRKLTESPEIWLALVGLGWTPPPEEAPRA